MEDKATQECDLSAFMEVSRESDTNRCRSFFHSLWKPYAINSGVWGRAPEKH